jgi:small subunit ribosomal protein S13
MNNFSKKKDFIRNFLRSNYGLGEKTGELFSNLLGLNKRISPNALKRRQMNVIKKKVKHARLNKKLKESTKSNISFLIRIKTYRGIRHKFKYPARGQRTHTNAKTKKKFKF